MTSQPSARDISDSDEGGSVGLEGSLEGLCGRSLSTAGFWEAQIPMELTGSRSPAVLVFNYGSSDDLDRIVICRVPSTHLHVEL